MYTRARMHAYLCIRAPLPLTSMLLYHGDV